MAEIGSLVMSDAAVVGSIVSMWRYPVKSMLGEELNTTEVMERGLMGDRAFALVDAETGAIISAKLPRKWGVLFDCRAALDSPTQVKITLPDGSIVMGNAADVNEILSQAFGRKVKLSIAPPEAPSIEMYTPDIADIPDANTETNAAIRPNTFFDAATVHLLTTATLNQFQSLKPTSRFETRRFRPNFVIQPISGATGFVENDWVGKTLVIGDQVRLNITEPCPRCVMTTMPQSELPNDVDILRTIVRHNQGHVGIYASVVQGGTIRRGDRVAII
ncbi:MOSC domain-containing protein [Phormidesmis priestleyi]|nr:MOSC N-terminal beta barrel domain-containing protein [Phormidesmis priestleyi]